MKKTSQLKRSMTYVMIGCMMMVFPSLTNSSRATELPEWLNNINLSGTIELEAGYESTSPAAGDGEDTSGLTLATAELGVEAAVTDYVSGFVLFAYEDDEDVYVDEATITLSGGESMPAYVTGGKLYVPFGNYETHMVSDPLTLDVGEARETALAVGMETGGFYGSAYLFNGDVNEADEEDDHISNFGINAGYTLEKDAMSLDVGAGYINNLIEADGWEGIFEDEGLSLSSYVGGVGAHAIFTMGAFTCIGEVVTALDDIEWVDETGALTTEDAILAYNAEVGFTFAMGEREGTVAVAYQGTENAYDRLPETRYMGAFGFDLMEGAGLAFEYLHDEFEGGDEADVFTAQLAIEF